MLPHAIKSSLRCEGARRLLPKHKYGSALLLKVVVVVMEDQEERLLLSCSRLASVASHLLKTNDREASYVTGQPPDNNSFKTAATTATTTDSITASPLAFPIQSSFLSRPHWKIRVVFVVCQQTTEAHNILLILAN